MQPWVVGHWACPLGARWDSSTDHTTSTNDLGQVGGLSVTVLVFEKNRRSRLNRLGVIRSHIVRSTRPTARVGPTGGAVSGEAEGFAQFIEARERIRRNRHGRQ